MPASSDVMITTFFGPQQPPRKSKDASTSKHAPEERVGGVDDVPALAVLRPVRLLRGRRRHVAAAPVAVAAAPAALQQPRRDVAVHGRRHFLGPCLVACLLACGAWLFLDRLVLRMAATVDLGVEFLGLGVDWLVAVRRSIEGWIDGVRARRSLVFDDVDVLRPSATANTATPPSKPTCCVVCGWMRDRTPLLAWSASHRSTSQFLQHARFLRPINQKRVASRLLRRNASNWKQRPCMLQIAPAGGQAAADLGKSSALDPSGKDDAVRRGGQTKDGRTTFFTALCVLGVRRAAAFTSRDSHHAHSPR